MKQTIITRVCYLVLLLLTLFITFGCLGESTKNSLQTKLEASPIELASRYAEEILEYQMNLRTLENFTSQALPLPPSPPAQPVPRSNSTANLTSIINQAINQSTNQTDTNNQANTTNTSNQTINQTTNQPIDPTNIINQTINQNTNQTSANNQISTRNQTINQTINQSTNRFINLTTNATSIINQTINQNTNQTSTSNQANTSNQTGTSNQTINQTTNQINSTIIPYYMTETIFPLINSTMKNQLRTILINGISHGNRPDVFIKIGDQFTANEKFLIAIGCQTEIIGNYSYLLNSTDYFRNVSLPPQLSNNWCGASNSYTRKSVSAHDNWTTEDLLTISSQNECGNILMTPYACEISLLQPSFAFIMIGTNDKMAYNNELWRLEYIIP